MHGLPPRLPANAARSAEGKKAAWTSPTRPGPHPFRGAYSVMVSAIAGPYAVTGPAVAGTRRRAAATPATAFQFGPTTQILSNPQEKQTEDYITGRFS